MRDHTDSNLDAFTAKRYEVSSYPTFIVIEPSSATSLTGKSTTWTETSNRDFKGMKKWIKGLANTLTPIADAPGFAARVSSGESAGA